METIFYDCLWYLTIFVSTSGFSLNLTNVSIFFWIFRLLSGVQIRSEEDAFRVRTWCCMWNSSPPLPLCAVCPIKPQYETAYDWKGPYVFQFSIVVVLWCYRYSFSSSISRITSYTDPQTVAGVCDSWFRCQRNGTQRRRRKILWGRLKFACFTKSVKHECLKATTALSFYVLWITFP